MLNNIILEDIEYIVKNINVKKCEGKSFFITGANGFLARYMVEVLIYLNEHILNEECTIIALCRNKKDASEKFKEYINRKYFKIIFQNVEEKIKYNSNIDYIIHAASKANTKEFGINPVGVLSANVIGTYRLLEYAKTKDIISFLFFSSGAVYGNIDETKEFVKETQFYSLDPLDVRSCYAESKRMGENMAFSYYKQFNIPTKIIRIGHTYGPGINLEDGHVFSDFVNRILNNEDLVIKSDGTAKRPFCYISDAIIAFFLVLFKGKNGEAYNMSNNKCFLSINDLAHILVEKTFFKKGLKVINNTNDRDLRSIDKAQVSVNIGKITYLGWNPEIGIEEGFKRTVDSFQIN
ncbi:NAD-dependent epimerase/dehydratase family protein [Clostridium chromiireducens]|uniref:NAD-dependent epimerase/dehydratase family protein n=1 Tax=Clostridium chromiireducens TaxID=225345 RepID=A0A399ISK9_9CLOT|nr:NAD-dependent epimerase/dehydratase family protein [Clostridium chromiireducens]RII33936.1 NAD-dependent epimerase/dehydratase family protein [Clostridium chromiireducens]